MYCASLLICLFVITWNRGSLGLHVATWCNCACCECNCFKMAMCNHKSSQFVATVLQKWHKYKKCAISDILVYKSISLFLRQYSTYVTTQKVMLCWGSTALMASDISTYLFGN